MSNRCHICDRLECDAELAYKLCTQFIRAYNESIMNQICGNYNKEQALAWKKSLIAARDKAENDCNNNAVNWRQRCLIAEKLARHYDEELIKFEYSTNIYYKQGD